jgi:hypothetical protein
VPSGRWVTGNQQIISLAKEFWPGRKDMRKNDDHVEKVSEIEKENFS